MTITDGHPDCVKNQNMCIQMNEEALENMINKTENSPNNTVFNDKYLRSTCGVSTSLLRWSVGDIHDDIKNLQRKKFDIIIAADCLFFENFHYDFIWILRNCLEKNGFCFLLQPKRGRTVDNFMSKIRISEDFLVVSVSDNYNDEVRQLKMLILYLFFIFYFIYSLFCNFFMYSCVYLIDLYFN